jgi:hypothetical protein
MIVTEPFLFFTVTQTRRESGASSRGGSNRGSGTLDSPRRSSSVLDTAVLAAAATTTAATTVIAVTPKAVTPTTVTAAQQHTPPVHSPTKLTAVTSPQQTTPSKAAVEKPLVKQPLAAVDQSDSPHRGGSTGALPVLKLAVGAGGKDGCVTVERDLCCLFDEVMEQSAIPTIRQGIVPKFIQSRHFDRCVRVTFFMMCLQL